MVLLIRVSTLNLVYLVHLLKSTLILQLLCILPLNQLVYIWVLKHAVLGIFLRLGLEPTRLHMGIETPYR